jgi:hypothetical protein
LTFAAPIALDWQRKLTNHFRISGEPFRRLEFTVIHRHLAPGREQAGFAEG